jgi:hypothetical protein
LFCLGDLGDELSRPLNAVRIVLGVHLIEEERVVLVDTASEVPLVLEILIHPDPVSQDWAEPCGDLHHAAAGADADLLRVAIVPA